MKIQAVIDRYYGENCYLIWDEDSGECAVIDPASDGVTDIVSSMGLAPKYILLTHGHFDHICGVNEFIKKYPVPLYIHDKDEQLLADSRKNASAFFGMDVSVKAEANTFSDGAEFSIGALTLKAKHTPGHTRGCVCFFCEDAVFTGDTLFAYDRGRTDLYGGDESTLLSSIEELRPHLSGKTIYPGHGGTRKF